MRQENKLKVCYSKAGRYLLDNQIWCELAILLTLEILVYHCLKTPPDSLYAQFVEETRPLYPGRFWFIAIENSRALLTMILLGLIPCGLGVLFGTYLSLYSLVSTGKYLLPIVGTKTLILGVLPHSLTEISAILLSIIIAALLSKAMTRFLIDLISKRRRLPIQAFKEEFLQISQVIFLIELPLIWISAWIETVAALFVNV